MDVVYCRTSGSGNTFLYICKNAGGSALDGETPGHAPDRDRLIYAAGHGCVDALRASKPANANLAYYLSHHLGFPVYRNTEITYFPLGEDKFRAMIPELEKARKYIFMEYFIVEKGYMWDSI